MNESKAFFWLCIIMAAVCACVVVYREINWWRIQRRKLRLLKQWNRELEILEGINKDDDRIVEQTFRVLQAQQRFEREDRRKR